MKNSQLILQGTQHTGKVMWTFSAIVFCLLSLMSPMQCLGGEEWWEGVCRKAEKTPLPVMDLPDAETAKTLIKCDSANLYYGFDIEPEPIKARHCAYLEFENEKIDRKDENVFGGSAILMMIYANGNGVKKNIDVAIKFACKVNGAQAEIDERIKHLQDLKRSKGGKRFDICDDITSGYMQGHCAERQQRFVKAKLKRSLEGILAKWSEIDKQSFAALKQSFGKFSDARTMNEVDSSGADRTANFIAEETALSEDFVNSIVQFEKGALPRYTKADFTNEDRELNALYKKIMSKKDYYWGSVKKGDIKLTQKVWLKYREAWVNFGRQKYPQVTEDSWRTWLTNKRKNMFKELLN